MDPPPPTSSPIPPAQVHDERPGPWLQWFSPRRFAWTRITLPIPNLHPDLDGLRLIHLTDLHFTWRWYPAHDELLERIANADADLVLLTGDLVERKSNYREGLPQVQRLFEGLQSRHGSYTILGNHDGHLLAPHLLSMNTHLIDEQFVQAPIRGVSIELIGLPGVDRAELDHDFLRQIPPRRDRVPRIVLSHYPDQVHAASGLHPDLVLAGHTHGGQICLPGGVPIVTHDQLPRRYASGVHRIAGTWLIVSRGMGFTGIPIRTFCPTQVIEISLRKN